MHALPCATGSETLTQPVTVLHMQGLERLQAHTNRLQHVQLEQAAAVERLNGAVRGLKGDVLAELARERQQLAQVRWPCMLWCGLHPCVVLAVVPATQAAILKFGCAVLCCAVRRLLRSFSQWSMSNASRPTNSA